MGKSEGKKEEREEKETMTQGGKERARLAWFWEVWLENGIER